MNVSDFNPDVSNLETTQASEIDSKAGAWERCPLLKLISTIWKAVKKIFKAIYESFAPAPYNLSKKDLEHLRAAKARMQPANAPPSPGSSRDLNSRNVEVKKTGKAALAEDGDIEEESEVEEDPVYGEFKREAMGFIRHALEVTFEETVEPAIPEIKKQIGNLDGYLKFGADVAIDVGSRLRSPLGDKLSKLEVSKILAPDLKQFMQWLLKDKHKTDQEEFVSQMEEKLTDIKDVGLRGEVIEQTRKWLFDTDQEEPLLKVGQDFSVRTALEKAQKEAIVLLTEYRITEFNCKIHEKLNGHLDDIIKKTLMNNGTKLGGIVLDRLVEVIDQAPFTETFNEVVSLLADHSEAVVSAEKARERAIKDEKARLARYDQAFKDSPQRDKAQEDIRKAHIALREDNVEKLKELWIKTAGIEAEQKCKEESQLLYQGLCKEEPESSELKSIKETGFQKWLQYQMNFAKEEAKKQAVEDIQAVYGSDDQGAIDELEGKMREKWFQKVGELAAQERYKEINIRGEQLCHPHIDELHLVQEKKEKASSDWLAKGIDILTIALSSEDPSDKHLFDLSADRLMKLLFPSVNVVDTEGRQDRVDGLLYLFDQVEYESEIKDIYNEAVYIYREVVTADKQKKIVEMLESKQEKIEQYVLRYARNEIRSTISEAISTLFQKVIVSKRIDELMAFDLLPATQETVVGALTKSIIVDNTLTYSSHFTAIVTAATEEEKRREKESLIGLVTGRVRENLSSYEIEEKKLKEFVEIEINELEISLQDFLSRREEEEDEDKELVIRSALKALFETEHHGSNARYGDLVVNTAFKLGGLSSTAETFANWFKGTLAKEISGATHEIQKSPHFLLKKATGQIHKNFGTKDAVKDLFFKEGEIRTSEAVQAKLKEEMEKTSKIAHDLLIYQSNQQPWYARKPIQWVIGARPDHLESVIKQVYQKMFGDELYTQNLMVRMQERIFSALHEGGKAVAANSRPMPAVKRLPSLIPSFMIESEDS